ncbi:hypothetical protein MKZ38_000963 [Zalerion maritima]|uniref:Uncharacterized protein n=1 Tax=Zalerion maritima TaxID=339359 RepID=A0AAD5WTF4_9PEZI|nr:hypothetical protein MKZ38_000963 [Zalerion maritima]
MPPPPRLTPTSMAGGTWSPRYPKTFSSQLAAERRWIMQWLRRGHEAWKQRAEEKKERQRLQQAELGAPQCSPTPHPGGYFSPMGHILHWEEELETSARFATPHWGDYLSPMGHVFHPSGFLVPQVKHQTTPEEPPQKEDVTETAASALKGTWGVPENLTTTDPSSQDEPDHDVLRRDNIKEKLNKSLGNKDPTVADGKWKGWGSFLEHRRSESARQHERTKAGEDLRGGKPNETGNIEGKTNSTK